MKTNNNSAQPAGGASTPGSSQPPASQNSQGQIATSPAPPPPLQAPYNINFELKDGKVQLTDKAKSILNTNLQTEAQQMGLTEGPDSIIRKTEVPHGFQF